MGQNSEEAAMAEHPNVQVMREGYAAFAKGDVDTLRRLMTPDVRWHVPGRTSLSGTYEGVDAVLGFFGRTMELTGGSFRAEPLTMLADDHYGAAPVRITAHRGDRHLDVMAVQAMRMQDGRVVEFWDTTTDQEAMEQFFD
jgi:ketosteroid isomerase-like protein